MKIPPAPYFFFETENTKGKRGSLTILSWMLRHPALPLNTSRLYFGRRNIMNPTVTLRLFNSIQIDRLPLNNYHAQFLERTIRNGYVLDPRIEASEKLLDSIEAVVGISGEKANAAFHKSWSIIENTPQEALWVQAAVHYLTTYGFETLGMYQKETVYIPREILELPETVGAIPLAIIKAMTAEEVLQEIVKLGSGIALKEETLQDIMEIVKANGYNVEFVERIKNRELKGRLYDHYGIVPQEPVEFLRYVVSKLTGESLLIKNTELIEKIKSSSGVALDLLLRQSPGNLASIFLRYKPIFLAMKSISENKTFFNRLRKKSTRQHVPLPEDYLNNVTCRIKNGSLSLRRLSTKLESTGVFRKIRLAHALSFRLTGSDSIIYRVRNGRGWASEFTWDAKYNDDVWTAFICTLQSIARGVEKNVKGKTIYIPPNVHYALPATEKQFTGFFPTGSYVSVDQDMIVGIHWCNTEKRVDLDLSAIGLSGKTGWDSFYTSSSGNMLFSGDMTDAPKPNGASELFYIKDEKCTPYIMYLNYYNFVSGDRVGTKILVAQEKPSKRFRENYMVDPNNIIACANIDVDKNQNVLGLIANVDGTNRFYFANVSIGKSITSGCGEQTTQARNYLMNDLLNKPCLRDILSLAGACVVEQKPKDEEYLDLSPNSLNKGTIIELLQ
jgi:hypothetical protein